VNNTNNKKIYDVVIIGGGPIGMFSAYLAKIKGLNVCLIEKNATLGGQLLTYLDKMIYDIPFSKMYAKDMVIKLANQLIESNSKIFLSSIFKTIKKKNNIFRLEFLCSSIKNIIRSKNIIIASGVGIFSPKKLEIPGTKKNSKIIYTINGIEKYKNKNIVILGGGDSAVDLANELYKISKNITIIHRRNEFRAEKNKVKNLRKNKIKLILNSLPTKIIGKKIIISNNENKKEITLNFDFVLVQYGQEIKNSTIGNLIKTIKIDKENKIIVDRLNQNTNIKNIYSVGDACTYLNKKRNITIGFGEAAVAINDIISKNQNKK
jgi:thioredoxin reductase (NADPH)